jgi:hypothetical protein
MSDSHRSKLIIVDDEAAQMKALCDTLGDRYEVTGFISATAGLQAIREKKFDLLLSDLMMPEMDGISLLQAGLKADPNLVAVIMTGEGTIATAVEAMKSGAIDYILKPFRLSAILPVLERALALQRLRVENAALERQVRERSEQLERANKELEAFSYSVSHDLRAPVRHVDGFAQMLARAEPGLSEKGKHFLTQITGAAKQMGQLIDNLLEFSRMGRGEMRRVPVNLELLRDEVIVALQPEMVDRQIVWKKNPLPTVQADGPMLRQVFQNLFFNAVKYSRPRNPAEIEIGAMPETAEEIVIFVRDNGVGFDMAHAQNLFGVFQRLHSQEEFEGTGVGLANVRRIVSRHGGRTWAEGKLEEGATFYFSLPRNP